MIAPGCYGTTFGVTERNGFSYDAPHKCAAFIGQGRDGHSGVAAQATGCYQIIWVGKCSQTGETVVCSILDIGDQIRRFFSNSSHILNCFATTHALLIECSHLEIAKHCIDEIKSILIFPEWYFRGADLTSFLRAIAIEWASIDDCKVVRLHESQARSARQ